MSAGDEDVLPQPYEPSSAEAEPMLYRPRCSTCLASLKCKLHCELEAYVKATSSGTKSEGTDPGRSRNFSAIQRKLAFVSVQSASYAPTSRYGEMDPVMARRDSNAIADPISSSLIVASILSHMELTTSVTTASHPGACATLRKARDPP